MKELVRALDNIPAANNGGTAARIPEGRRFQPGNSGNPRGRPKRDFDVAELARQHTNAAVETLAEVMSDRRAPASARVSAAQALLDRGYGRPPQSLDLAHQNSFSRDFEEFIWQLSAREGSAHEQGQ